MIAKMSRLGTPCAMAYCFIAFTSLYEAVPLSPLMMIFGATPGEIQRDAIV